MGSRDSARMSRRASLPDVDAAFDRNILGVRPDLVIEVRADILREVDGPMLKHGLQEIAGVRLNAPQSVHLRPREDFLEERYELFRRAG
jgi:putative restriction endonuclease